MPPTESRATISRMLPYASNERCPAAAELCHKAYAREPLLPVLPAFGDSTATGRNPCLRLEMGRGSVLDSCLPGANLLGGWHTLGTISSSTKAIDWPERPSRAMLRCCSCSSAT